ncbi:protein WEAK CHLOROPLAST MOVEMENT UNDER BLUE LIGHT-like 1 isoform X2 [Miscanthus floridulus]
MQVEALQKAVQGLSEQYKKDCMDAHLRIAQLEAENISIMSRQSETDGECEALRGELAAVRADLDAARESVAFVLREVEAMETRAILEREGTKDALARILQLNETVLSSAVAAIRAEEERSVFFQESTLQLLDSDRNLEVIRRQIEMMERMEMELLAKTVEVEYLRAELKQAKEIYVSPPRDSDATTVLSAAGCSNLDGHDQVQGREQTAVEDTEAELEFTFQHSPGLSFVSDEIFRQDSHAVPSGGSQMEFGISEDLAENQNKQGAAVMVGDTTVAEGNSDAQETRCLVAKISGEDNYANQPRVKFKCTEADSNQEPAEPDGALPDFTTCQANDVIVQDHVDTKADASFVLESSRDDFQSVHSDAKDVISIAEADDVASAANQEPRAEPAAAPTSTPREGSSDTCAFATEIVSKDEDEFYTKELEPEPGQGTRQLDGYVLVSTGGDAGAGADVAVKDKQLDEARTEISDLRFSLEEAVRRAELAEEAKAALERELREEIRRKHTPSRRRATSDSEDGWRPAAAREGARPTTPARPRPTSSSTSGTPSRALRSARPGGEDMPPPRCLTLGKVLNMKYK